MIHNKIKNTLPYKLDNEREENSGGGEIGRKAKGSLGVCARGQNLGRREQWTARCGSVARARLGCTARTPD